MNATGSTAFASTHESGYSDSYSTLYRRRRGKNDWAGVGLGDAFKSNLDYYVRMPAQRLFYRLVRAVQIAAAREAGAETGPGFEPLAKPQLSPCYTNYPPNLAACAAIGLTGYLEFEARVSTAVLMAGLKPFVEDPSTPHAFQVDPVPFRAVVERLAHSVQTRLLLESLSRQPAMRAVEVYRLFSASQQSLRFDTIQEIIQCAILYGDILPDWETQDLHPLTRRVLNTLDEVNAPFFRKLETAESGALMEVGLAWVKTAASKLAPYLPELSPGTSKSDPRDDLLSCLRRKGLPAPDGATMRFAPPSVPPHSGDVIPPLDGPVPPSLGEPETLVQRLAAALLGPPPPPSAGGPATVAEEVARQKEVRETLNAIGAVLDKASGQPSGWEDMRSDLVESQIRSADFRPGPIQGDPTDGHEVSVTLGDAVAGGEIHDRALPLCENPETCQTLVNASAPIAQALRNVLYPNVEELPETEWLCTSGSLDPRRLPLAEITGTVFKRYRIVQRASPRGRPVLLIACDGSASLSANQMKMTKLLAAGWLGSTAKSDIQVLAGLYHSGIIRRGNSGPLVQWMYHPKKTAAASRAEALRALASLPDCGTGAQSDALSIAFMLDEAWALARGRIVYLILVSDCAWNSSFRNGKNGFEETRLLLESTRAEHPDRLHATLVSLGNAAAAEFGPLIDKVLHVSEEQLTDPVAVARKIGLYVAACMKERRRFLQTH